MRIFLSILLFSGLGILLQGSPRSFFHEGTRDPATVTPSGITGLSSDCLSPVEFRAPTRRGMSNTTVYAPEIMVSLSQGTSVQVSIPNQSPAPRIYLVHDECVSQLRQLYQDTLETERRFFREGATFPFSPTRSSDVCGVSAPGNEVCSNVFLESTGNEVADVNQAQGPIVLQSILQIFQRPLDQDQDFQSTLQRIRVRRRVPQGNATEDPQLIEATQTRIRQLLEDQQNRVTLFITRSPQNISPFSIVQKVEIRTPPSERELRRLRDDEPRPRDQIEVRTNVLGTVAFIRSQYSPGATEWRGITASEAFEKVFAGITDAVDRQLDSGFFMDSTVRKTTRAVRIYGETLSRYWEKKISFISDGADQLRESILEFQPSNVLRRIEMDPSQPGSDREASAITKVSVITQAAIQEASKGLGSSTEPDVLNKVASLWWAGRFIQTSVGCSLEPTDENSLGRNMVIRQFDHQQCRRIYATRTYTELNQLLDSGEPLTLSSRAWTLNYALGSRLERAKLFSRALPILVQQIDRGVFPSREDISAIAHEVSQSIIELELHQSLAWTGLQEMSDAQRTEIEGFLATAKVFFITLAQRVMPTALVQPGLYRLLMDAWRILESALELPPLSQFQVADAVQLDALTARINALAPDSSESIVSLLHDSRDFIELRSLSQTAICRTWQDWLMRRRPHTTLPPPPEERLSRTCMTNIYETLALEPSARPVDAAGILDQCLRQKSSHSCETFFFYQDSKNAGLTPQQWTALFQTSSPNETQLIQWWTRLFFESRRVANQTAGSNASRARGRSTRTRPVREAVLRRSDRFAPESWEYAQVQIEEILFQRAAPILQGFPSLNDLQNCVDSQRWTTAMRAQTITQENALQFIRPGCSRSQNIIGLIQEAARQCTAMSAPSDSPASRIEQSFFDPIQSLSFWLAYIGPTQPSRFSASLAANRSRSSEPRPIIPFAWFSRVRLTEVFDVVTSQSHLGHDYPLQCLYPRRDSLQGHRVFGYFNGVRDAFSRLLSPQPITPEAARSVLELRSENDNPLVH